MDSVDLFPSGSDSVMGNEKSLNLLVSKFTGHQEETDTQFTVTGMI